MGADSEGERKTMRTRYVRTPHVLPVAGLLAVVAGFCCCAAVDNDGRAMEQARAAARMRDFDGARTSYTLVIAGQSAAPALRAEAQLGIAETFWAQQRYTEARAAYRLVVGLAGARPEHRSQSQLGVAHTYDAQKTPIQAREAYAAVLKIEGLPREHESEAWLELGKSYHRVGRYASAESAFGNVLKIWGDASAAHREEALKWLRGRRPRSGPRK
jgi:tetratricopeptide (TPR) repeat protein